MKSIYLRTARTRKGWTQERLEAETKRRGRRIAQAIISKLERNPNANPTFGTQVTLADALDVDPRALKFGPVPERMTAA